MDRCNRPCVPTNWRGTWVCEVCGYVCDAPKLPAVGFNPAVAPGSQKVVNVDPGEARTAARAAYIESLKGLGLLQQYSAIVGVINALQLDEYFR